LGDTVQILLLPGDARLIPGQRRRHDRAPCSSDHDQACHPQRSRAKGRAFIKPLGTLSLEGHFSGPPFPRFFQLPALILFFFSEKGGEPFLPFR